MYTSYYLRFADETECNTVLSAVGYCTCQMVPAPPAEPVEDQPEEPPAEVEQCWYTTGEQDGSVDIIGILYNDDAVIDPDTGEVITPPTPMPGWHVNIALRGDLPVELQTYLVAPRHPRRVFAGLG